jgi:(2Fe-2S) ferredoxin
MEEVTKPTMANYKRHVVVCVGELCTKNSQGLALYNDLKQKLKIAGLDKGESRIIRSKSTCLGICKSGPLLCVHPDGIWYYDINNDKLDRIIDEHLVAGNPVQEWVCHNHNNPTIPSTAE